MYGLLRCREGLSFYGKGTQILLSDLQYAWYLITRALGGYTLKPRYIYTPTTYPSIYPISVCYPVCMLYGVVYREVNSIRRTGKYMLTLIPFTIILIVPLTPVGHVLAFSFIQVGR